MHSVFAVIISLNITIMISLKVIHLIVICICQLIFIKLHTIQIHQPVPLAKPLTLARADKPNFQPIFALSVTAPKLSLLTLFFRDLGAVSTICFTP